MANCMTSTYMTELRREELGSRLKAVDFVKERVIGRKLVKLALDILERTAAFIAELPSQALLQVQNTLIVHSLAKIWLSTMVSLA